MRYLLAVLAVTVLSSPVAAQDLKLPTIAFAGAATADWITTHQLLNRGGGESNPTLSWLAHKPTAMIAVGVGMDVAGYYAWHRLTKKHTKIRLIGLYGAAALRTYFAVQNHRLRR